MASGGVLTHPHDVRPLGMKSDKLTVQGTGITPRATSPASGLGDTASGGGGPDQSSRSSLTSDDDVTRSLDDEADSMLQGVVSMNKILEDQIEALRLRLQVEDKQHREEKSRLRQEKDGVILGKEAQIEDLRESLADRDERLHALATASQEKDLTIRGQVDEIEGLRRMAQQAQDYAQRLHRQIGQVKHKKQVLETDTLYKEQNSEISRLNVELQELKKRLSDMEQELHRAAKIIEEQTTRIRQMEEERGSMHAKFREELEKATKAMRQEVERMRAVMRQNYEEMRRLREENHQMHSDVKDIKDLLLKSKSPTPREFRATGVQRPLTASPMNLLPAELNARTPSPPKGSPHPRTSTLGQAPRTSRPEGAASSPKPGGEGTARAASRTAVLHQRDPSGRPPGGPGAKGGERKVTPTICGLKEGSALPAISRQPTNHQLRTKSALRLSSGKLAKK